MTENKRLLVLASKSPRRRELLGIAGFMFSVISADVDETPLDGEPPRDYTLRVSKKKANAVIDYVNGYPLILAADTTVAYGETIFGKPTNAKEAEAMLVALRGRTHQVHTAVVVLDSKTNQMESEIATTDVPMRNFTDQEIADYIASGDPFDKAGSYAIQNEAFHPVDHIEGSYHNVVGFPVDEITLALDEVGYNLKS